ncbi:membrane protease subunit HflK [Candidatus Kinetoplastibacterium blastocrithidii TCC012E]|uniref:Protein HflK n=1 Tax=Candidatus Kinetoplastidibacterium blastocrithidiae TCC012E TaxID=1208922 RepID=M1MDL7_9PROT|nr:FtsH protease activity modulator HflK [Candidatus Kinetoplastibacterium blastocrithidii]AFZ83693.1 membrane protease subunit HflK [Candidatus Kinetoplastibacterium blastocrithidii (ex Strigomonas culicis)]AGF49815.1 membrane protease subunit HflK [Candidatus Kinetoplastibacterium blastocrithidii TCC012E]
MSKILLNLNDSGWGRKKNMEEKVNSLPNNSANKNIDDGPPDLSEVWDSLNKKISNVFGKKNNNGEFNSSGHNGFSNKNTFNVLIVSFLLLFVIWIASGFFVVKEGQVAVITRFGKYLKTTHAGFSWIFPAPIEKYEIVNISQLRTFEVGSRGGSRNKVLTESLMLTTDENIVDMQFVVQYRLNSDGAPDYLFKTRDPDESVRQAAETSMREIVGRKTMDFVLYEGRTLVASEVQNLMQKILDNYNTGIQITAVAIQNVQPPEQVQDAFDDAVKAGQDRERQINEGQAYANQVVPLARGQAFRVIEEAEGYKARIVGDAKGNASRFDSILIEYEKSPEVTKDRLYLDAMKDIFSSVSKVMVDSSNNNFMVLPLDKMIRASSGDGNDFKSDINSELRNYQNISSQFINKKQDDRRQTCSENMKNDLSSSELNKLQRNR